MSYKIKKSLIFAILFLLLTAIIMPSTVSAAKNNAVCSLQFVSTPSDASIPFGGNITYRYSLKNIGSLACAGTSVSVFYADNEKYVSSTPAPSASDYYWSMGRLSPGQSYSFSVTIKNVSSDSNQMLGEACASANGARDACVSKSVTLNMATTPALPPASSSTPTSTSSSTVVATAMQAWIYPGSPACNSTSEYSDGRQIDTLKPEYYTVQVDGNLRQKTVTSDGCNGYSTNNILDIKNHSTHQYVTVSGDVQNVHMLLSSTTLQNSAIKILTDFVVSTGFTGVEIDWEGFSQWTATDYANYKSFTTSLQNSLHAKGKLLIIDAPAISDATYQSYFPFRYEDFTNVDYVAIMAYDYQYDFGVGQPVAPEAWVRDVINWAKNRLEPNKIIIGVPAYGYHGILGSYNIIIDTYAQSATYPGFSTRRANTDGEETWMNGNTYYVVQASSTLDRKKALIESLGIKNISVWHLGGNLWFTKIN